MKKSYLVTKVIISFLVVAFIIMSVYVLGNFYPRTAMITEIDEANNIITLTCSNGNVFSTKREIEDFMVGNICSMLMYDCGTEYVCDDKVVVLKYDGYLELFESIHCTE